MAAGVTCSFSSAVFFLLLLNCILFVSTNVDEVIDDGDENDRALGPSGYMKREYSAIKPFVGGTSMQFWEMKGDSLLTDDYIRLTSDQQSKSGAVWNTLPVMVRDWEVHVHFKVQGQNTRFFGDGFAFWYTKDRSELGPVFGAKDYHDGLSIFFDTYANQNGEHSHEHPYISAQINNGTTHYDHDKDGTHSALAGCTAHFRGVDAETHVAIRYLGSRKRLTVQHDMDDENKWAECFDRYGVELPTGYFLGFSSQTGDLSDNHDLISVKFYELASNDAEDDPAQYLNIQPKADGAEPERDHSEDDKVYTRKDRALNWFLGIVLVLIAIALLGFFYYQKMQRDNMKRFY